MPTRTPNTPPNLLAAIEREDWFEALCLAARFRFLGAGDAAIRRAWSAERHPAFYQELGHDLEAVRAAGIAALRARFAPDQLATFQNTTPSGL